MKKKISEEDSYSSSVVLIAEPSDQTSGRAIAGRADPALISGVIVGRLVGLHEPVEPLVDFPDNPFARALLARSAIPLQTRHVGCEVLLSFERGELERPVVVGIMYNHAPRQPKPIEMTMDDESVVFTAQKEITLRCGKASITLTRAGKVLIKGEYVSARAAGVNRIKGGVVHIN